MPRTLSIYSFNVNGIRAAAKKGLLEWLAEQQPDLLGMQEVRATEEQMTQKMRTPQGFDAHFVAAERLGYSGVGIYTRKGADAITWQYSTINLDAVPQQGDVVVDESFDAEGRLQIARAGKLLVVNGYFPNGNGKERDNSRVPYKLEFYARLKKYLELQRSEGMRIIVMGDWNTAHRDVDLARPKQNRETSGFLPIECEAMDQWMRDGWVDSFRHFVPAPTDADIDELVAQAKKAGLKKAERALHSGEGRYTWWSQRVGVREKNIGWRIDYALVSPELVPYLRGAEIHPDVKGSDHCPISLSVDASAVE